MLNIDKLKYDFEACLLGKLKGISCEIPGIEDNFIYLVNKRNKPVFSVYNGSKTIDLNGKQLLFLLTNFKITNDNMIFIVKQFKKLVKTHFYPDYDFTFVLKGVRRAC